MAARADGRVVVAPRRARGVWLPALVLGALVGADLVPASGQLLPVDVIGEGQLNGSQGGMPPPFVGGCGFGSSVARLGDLDGDGLASYAIGAPGDTSGAGAVWVLELEADGDVAGAVRIGPDPFGMGSALGSNDEFGRSVDALGDVDGDGLVDLAVGASGDGSGAVWILFLDADGGLRSSARIDAQTPGFCATLASGDLFGRSVAALGDLDGDGAPDVAVGAPNHDFGGSNAGAVFLLSLSPAGGLLGCTRLASGESGLPTIDPSDQFGSSLAVPGDLDGDGTLELAVGAPGEDDALANSGAVWLLSLDASGLVAATHKLGPALFGGAVTTSAPMGPAVGALGDLDGNGVSDLAIGVPGDDDGTTNTGAVWIAFLQADFGVAALQKISNLAGGFGGLGFQAAFGSGLPPTLRGDSQPLPSGAPGGGPSGEPNKGATWLLALSPAGTVASAKRLAVGTPGLEDGIDQVDDFGAAAADLGDRDGDGRDELVIGAPGDADGGAGNGALWIVEFDAAGALAQPPLKLSALVGGLQNLAGGSGLGSAIATLGDLSGDGTLEVAVGGPFDDAGAPDAGAVWVLSINAHNQVVAQTKISALSGLPPGALNASDQFGAAVAAPGDLDGDAVADLVVGTPRDDDGGNDTGAVWVLLLLPSGGVKATHKLGEFQAPLGSALASNDRFGGALAALGDGDGDGRLELAAGAAGSDDGGSGTGSVFLLELEPGGAGLSTVRELNALTSGLLDPAFKAGFGSSLATLPDLDADGRPELVAGMPQASLGATQAGAVGMLAVRPDGSVRDQRVIGLATGGFGGSLEDNDNFGTGLGVAGDLDGNGSIDLVVGAPNGGDAMDGGAAWTLRLPRGAWTAQGTGVAGTHGVPLIAALGPLVPGTPLRFELNEARRYAPCWLFIGTSELLAPFKGGVLVPYPALALPQSTDGFGFKAFGGTWPAGVPSGATLYVQWWVVDPNAVQGLSATPAARGVVP